MQTERSESGMSRRSELLLGQDVMDSIRQKRVIIFGVGGVGSWCAESLVRSGFCHLTIVDFDRVSESNINRQLMATCETVGQMKVDVLRERLLAINPEAEITALQKQYNADTVDDFRLEDYDYVVDAIDSLESKALLILNATRAGVRFFSSMGAALKLDPQRIAVAEFWQVKGCPLARALRHKFKHRHEFPARKFQCVYSDELLPNKETDPDEPRANGSLVHVTATFGFTLAGLIIQSIYHNHGM